LSVLVRTFDRKETGIKIVLNNCLPDYDRLAEQFVQSEGSSIEQKKVMQSAADQLTQLSEINRKSGQIYVKIMERMLDKGADFVQLEKERVTKILQGKLTTNKKKDLEGRLNILQSFSRPLAEQSKSDL
jgi:hypothetical protein